MISMGYFFLFLNKSICCGYTWVNICFYGELETIILELSSNTGQLSLSRIPRDCLKYFEISVPRHIRFAELRKNKSNNHTFHKCICNLTPEVRDILKILWKKFSSFPQYFVTYC